jgi:hypothetical protein
MRIRTGLCLLLLSVAPLCAPSAFAQEVDDNIYNYLQLMRSDLNSVKVELVNGIMKLSEADAATFWPIYNEYERELGRQAVSRAELVVEFVQSHGEGTFDDARAADVAARWFKAQRARLKLLERYHRKIEKALSPVLAARFLQIENQIGIFIDMTIASEMPLVGQRIK